MKVVELSKDGAQKIFKGINELYPRDLDDSIKSYTPGEWVYFKNSKKEIYYLGFLNPLAINTPVAHIIDRVTPSSLTDEEYLLKLIDESIRRRSIFLGYENCSRLIYGNADNLPGLIVDSYVNCIIIQINTAGIDRFREKIKEYLLAEFPGKKVYLLDNALYRERESLPIFEKEKVTEDLKILENDLHIKVSQESIQKVGYYYDHRENRDRAVRLINKLNKKFINGLDLFSYVGSWGLHFLSAGVEKVLFVDQGNMEKSIQENLSINEFSSRGDFKRINVFDYLKEAKINDQKFDIICSDPPAFCKSKKEERKAYEGYLKLHKGLFEILDTNSILIACSCTHYISFESFQKNILEAAISKGRKIHLLDCGVQGFDHPTTSLNNKNTYLKYLAYKVE